MHDIFSSIWAGCNQIPTAVFHRLVYSLSRRIEVSYKDEEVSSNFWALNGNPQHQYFLLRLNLLGFFFQLMNRHGRSALFGMTVATE